MSKNQDRKNIVKAINDAAQLYREHLVGKRFIYVFEDRYIEVIYKASSFRHLTGVATNLSAKSFYRFASNRQLQANQIYFTAKHPYDLCKKKIKHIGELAALSKSESFMLEEIITDTKTYKFGTTNLNFTLCLAKELDDIGNEKGDCFIVESLRDEDCFSKSKSAYTVTHIFSRSNDVKKYTDILYIEPSTSINELPENIKEMLSDELKHT